MSRPVGDIIGEALGKMVLGGAGLIVVCIINGWVLTKVWVWLVLPIFSPILAETSMSLPTLTIAKGIALSFIISFLWGLPTIYVKLDAIIEKVDDKEVPGFGENLVSSVVWNLTLLGIAYIISLFI